MARRPCLRRPQEELRLTLWQRFLRSKRGSGDYPKGQLTQTLGHKLKIAEKRPWHQGDIMLQADQDLPSLLAELPNAYALLVQWHGQQAMKSSASSSTGPEPPIPVQGNAFINNFCGEAAFALGMVFQQVPCVEPWNSQSYDVLNQGWILVEPMRTEVIIAGHPGIPCQSLTWCREPQLRSFLHIMGLFNLTTKQRELVDKGHHLAMWGSGFARTLHEAGGLLSMENPELTWLWLLKSARALHALPRVIITRSKYKDYITCWSKPTGVLHNIAGLKELADIALSPSQWQRQAGSSSGARCGGTEKWSSARICPRHVATTCPQVWEENSCRIGSSG